MKKVNTGGVSEDFLRTISPGNDEELMNYLKMDEDRTHEEVESAINYLKLRKIKRMLLENQVDMEKQHTPEEYAMLHQTHEHLKLMEREISSRIGSVIIK
jgi:DNA primase